MHRRFSENEFSRRQAARESQSATETGAAAGIPDNTPGTSRPETISEDGGIGENAQGTPQPTKVTPILQAKQQLGNPAKNISMLLYGDGLKQCKREYNFSITHNSLHPHNCNISMARHYHQCRAILHL